MDKRIQDILTHLAGAASYAADGVTDAVQTASHVVGEKYDVLKLHVEIGRLQNEQERLFAGIGRVLYKIQSGEAEALNAEEAAADTQDMVDRLLVLADQKQQEIDAAQQRLHKLNGAQPCASCGQVAEPSASFCPACGEPLTR